MSLPTLPSTQSPLQEDDRVELLSTAPLSDVPIPVLGKTCSSGGLALPALVDASVHSADAPASDASSHAPSSREGSPDRSVSSGSPGGSEVQSQGVASLPSSSGQRSLERNRTTFMIRGLPRAMTRAQLEQLLNVAGFSKQYDFLYLPTNLKTRECYGYGIVNLTSAAGAAHFTSHFDGFSWPDAGQPPLVVQESKASEGLDALIHRYRNSSLLQGGVPEEAQPALYRDGVQVPFPTPTMRPSVPRRRSSLGLEQSGSWGAERTPRRSESSCMAS